MVATSITSEGVGGGVGKELAIVAEIYKLWVQLQTLTQLIK